jgi:hypothetical protein
MPRPSHPRSPMPPDRDTRNQKTPKRLFVRSSGPGGGAPGRRPSPRTDRSAAAAGYGVGHVAHATGRRPEQPARRSRTAPPWRWQLSRADGSCCTNRPAGGCAAGGPYCGSPADDIAEPYRTASAEDGTEARGHVTLLAEPRRPDSGRGGPQRVPPRRAAVRDGRAAGPRWPGGRPPLSVRPAHGDQARILIRDAVQCAGRRQARTTSHPRAAASRNANRTAAGAVSPPTPRTMRLLRVSLFSIRPRTTATGQGASGRAPARRGKD